MLTLSTRDLRLEDAGLLLAIDTILDMGRTAMNVAGQVLASAVVAKREEYLMMWFIMGWGSWGGARVCRRLDAPINAQKSTYTEAVGP